MSIRKKPYDAVTILQAYLDRARNNVQRTDALDAQFCYIQEQLQNMNEPLQSFKRREKSLIDELCLLEIDLYDSVCSPTDTQDMEAQFLQKLDHIRRKVDWLNNLLSMVEPKLVKGLRPKEKPTLKPDHIHQPTISKEWLSFQFENDILRSEEMLSQFSSRFHCLESSQVKMCLLHLSIFPENVLIKKKPIIYWWMGEGLVSGEGEGGDVFDELIKERFLKADTKSQWPTVNSFTVPPWIRRMLMVEAKKCKLIDLDSEGKVRNGEWSRALLLQGNDELFNIDGSLWTVFNLTDRVLRIRSNWGFGKLKKMKVLQLGRWQSNRIHHIEVENQDILNGLGSSLHLKYLSLRGISQIEALPNSILRLPSLEILDLRACHNLEMLPDGIWELNGLTHLDVSECYLLESIPSGIQHLRSLLVLKGFVIGKTRKNACKLSDLRKLDKLRKLSIRVVGDDYSDLDLSSFLSLRILTISWSLLSTPSMSLPSSLTKLELRCLPGTELPFGEPWELEKLYICGGKLKSLRRMNTVKFIRLKYLTDLTIHGEELESLFPEYLFIHKIRCGAPCPYEFMEKTGPRHL